MNYNERFGKYEKTIGPGEYYCTDEDIIITTLLGSCISVTLFDIDAGLGGMNHFMLPVPKTAETGAASASTKYGIHAMEVLINTLLKMGARKDKLQAKVFGGSTFFTNQNKTVYDIPRLNISFIQNFLFTERLPIVSFSVGGTLPRRILFFPRTAKVLMKNTHIEQDCLAQLESRYAHELLEQTEGFGNSATLY